jgi:hypothetical protein
MLHVVENFMSAGFDGKFNTRNETVLRFYCWNDFINYLKKSQQQGKDCGLDEDETLNCVDYTIRWIPQ